MKKNILSIAALSLLCMGFASCSDDELPYSEAQVTNTELRTILEKQGIQFDETGHMLLDDKVQNLTKLDLTGTKFTDFNSLTILPNLNELDLSDNEFGPAFDFSTLPAQITGVDLTGNEIYDYNNLIKVEIAENGDETVSNLRKLVKLHLPDEAAENTTDLVRYYVQNKEAIEKGELDLQMEDENGKLATYTTLRSIPDPVLTAHLKKQFGSIFEGDQIDLSKRLNMDENVNNIILNPYLTENFDKLANLEGVQYIIQHPSWEGTTITIMFPEAKELPAIKLPKFVTSLYLSKLNAKGLDLSGAENLSKISLTEVNGIEEFDLRGSKVWGQREFALESKGLSKLSLLGCKDLKNVYFPEAKQLRAKCINLEGLPALETCDITKFSFILDLTIGNVPASYKVVYPNITEFKKAPEDGINFACSNSTYALQATKDFIEKYKNYNGQRMIYGNNLSYDSKDEAFWR